MDASATTMRLNELISQQDRSVHLRNKRGDLYGGNHTIPKGDFAHFLGYKAPTPQERSGEKNVTARRALEIALHDSMNKVGEGAMQRGMAYRNMFISHGRYANKPGQEKELLRDGMDAVQTSLEQHQQFNLRYLEMQYKFQMASVNFGAISNLMRVRNESTRKAMQQGVA